jgi:hypothetical protein
MVVAEIQREEVVTPADPYIPTQDEIEPVNAALKMEPGEVIDTDTSGTQWTTDADGLIVKVENRP